jgi:UDP:flavonoid glycosyltransferase YjiC (YdhE family)
MASDRAGGPRALLFPDANFLAHVSRLVEVGKRLRGDFGFEVVFAGDGPYLALARDGGFETRPCYTVPKEATLELAREAALVEPFWWRREVFRSIRSDMDAIEMEHPDVVVGDMHWSLGAAALASGVPYASIVNASWTNYFDHEIEPLDGHVLTRVLGRARAARWFPWFKKAALWYWAVPYKLWRFQTRRPQLRAGNIFSVIEGDATIFPDVPEFCPTRGAPPSVSYAGPILWRPDAPSPPSLLSLLDRARKTIYVSMGSTGKRKFFETAIRAFAGTEYQVIMTTGEISLAGEALPGNIHVTDFAPGHEIMKHSQVSVNQGGNGTIYQALEAGVPIVGVPTHVDQQIQMQLCERSGVGRRIREAELSEATLRDAVAAVLADPNYRLRAQALSRVIANRDGAREAAARIAALARRSPATLDARAEAACPSS